MTNRYLHFGLFSTSYYLEFTPKSGTFALSSGETCKAVRARLQRNRLPEWDNKKRPRAAQNQFLFNHLII